MPAAATPAKPLKLHVNTSGAWKDVIRFDGSNDAESQSVMDAADTLGRLHSNRNVTFRIAADDHLIGTLMRWTFASGWKEVTRGAD